MKSILILVAGVFLGGLVIGGLLFSIFSNSAGNPKRDEEVLYTWLGRIIGLIIAAIIVSNL